MSPLQSLSSMIATAMPMPNQDHTTTEATDFDDLLNSMSKTENVSASLDKTLDDPKSEVAQPAESTLQADSLLAMLMPQPTTATAQTTAPTPTGSTVTGEPGPSAGGMTGKLPSSFVAPNLSSQLETSVLSMPPVTSQPLAETVPRTKLDMALDSALPLMHQPMDLEENLPEFSNLLSAHRSQSFPEIEAPSAPNETLLKSHVPATFGHEGWDKAISQRVTWLIQDQLKSATLTLTPPHLGPIQVHIQLDQQQINVQFFAALPEVRQALQEAIPVLKSMMHQSGLALGQSDVSDHQKPSKNPSKESKGRTPFLGIEDTDNSTPSLTSPYKMGSGLLNTFA